MAGCSPSSPYHGFQSELGVNSVACIRVMLQERERERDVQCVAALWVNGGLVAIETGTAAVIG